jgi:hypothetical protein
MIKEWSPEETEKLKNLFRNTSLERLSSELGRSIPSINCKAYRMGIKTKKYAGWTHGEIERLRNHFPNKTTKELADEFGRSVNSVRQKAFRLRLKKKLEHLRTIGLAKALSE